MGIIEGLPQSVQDAINPTDSAAQAADASRPQIPGTNMPLPPNAAQNSAALNPAGAPPNIGSTIAEGSLADKISKAFLEHLSKNQPTPVQSKKPSVGQNIMGVANGIAAGLADASHANEVKGGGWLSGVTSTLAARENRIAGTRQREFENQQQKQRDDALVARNQAETVQLVRNIHKQDTDTRAASYAQGKSFVDSLRNDHQVTDNVTHDELTSMIQKNPGYLQSHYVRPVGEEPVLDGSGNPKVDPNGNPVMSPLYSLIDRAPISGGTNAHKVSPEEAAYFKTNLGKDYPVGTPLTIDQYTALSGQAHKTADTTQMINKDREDAFSTAQRDQLRTDLSDDQIQHYVATIPGSALGGLYKASKDAAADIKIFQGQILEAQKKGDANAVQQLQGQLKTHQDEAAKVNRVITNAFSDKDRDTYQSNIEKALHDRREEEIQNRRADVQAQKETQQKGLGDSYKTENKEFDTVRKPIATQLDSMSTLRSSLDQGTAAGDALVAPALLKALVAGGGVRITQAEIRQFTNGRSSLEDMKGVLQKIASGKSITPEQRKQVYALVGAVEVKAQQKQRILSDGQDALDGATSVEDQRKAVANARQRLAAVDFGQSVQQQQAQKNVQPANDPFAQFGGKAH
jgi:hypothetical protein